MNFLAHFHLAWPDASIMAGSLEGEYYKGRLDDTSSHPLAIGIRHHRAVDAYTDTHPALTHLKNRFPTRLRRYAGILVDLSFDHYLTLHWNQFSNTPLPVFCDTVHAALAQAQPHLGERASAMHARLVEHELLSLYAHWDTIPRAARNIGQRFRRDNPFVDINDELSALRPALETAFLEFYPELLEHSRDILMRLSHTQRR